MEQVANAPEEIKVFSDRVKAAGISLVVVEASGGYEQLALLTIYNRPTAQPPNRSTAIAVVLLHPRAIFPAFHPRNPVRIFQVPAHGREQAAVDVVAL